MILVLVLVLALRFSRGARVGGRVGTSSYNSARLVLGLGLGLGLGHVGSQDVAVSNNPNIMQTKAMPLNDVLASRHSAPKHHPEHPKHQHAWFACKSHLSGECYGLQCLWLLDVFKNVVRFECVSSVLGCVCLTCVASYHPAPN